MDEKIIKSWEKLLYPKTLRTNIIAASIYITAFEMLKNTIVDKIKGFYTDGFDEKGFIISPEYEKKVLSLNKSPLYASLFWLKNSKAIDNVDIEKFEEIKKCRNVLTHEMLKFVSEGIEYDFTKLLSQMVELTRKIELWWFKYFEMEINPEAYPKDLDPNEVIPGPIWALQMIVDVALGTDEEAGKYYEYFTKNKDNSK